MRLPFLKNRQSDDVTVIARSASPGAARVRTSREYSGPSSLKRMALSFTHMGLGKFRSSFIQNLAMMLGAGLHVTDAIETLLKEAPRAMKKIINGILRDVENGSALWRAMDQQAFFTPYAIALIRIGEESGNLSQNLANLSEQDEKNQAMRQKVKMAMIYPSIVITLTIIITIGLSWFVLPQLIGVLYALNVELPATTLAVIAVANFFTQHGAVVVPSGLAVLFILSLLFKFTRLRVVAQWMVLHIPGVKTLIIEASIAQFGNILGTLLRAGVAPVESIQSLADVTSMQRYRSFYSKLTEHIRVGDSFAKSFEEMRGSRRILPPSVQQIIITGERSGRLSEVLLKIADIYQKKAEETAQKLPIILEPVLLIFIAGLVAMIAFSIIMPIYSVVGNISGGG
ncbi:MAG: type II secretion system F family protein [Patescibacteria group bacterium]